MKKKAVMDANDDCVLPMKKKPCTSWHQHLKVFAQSEGMSMPHARFVVYIMI